MENYAETCFTVVNHKKYTPKLTVCFSRYNLAVDLLKTFSIFSWSRMKHFPFKSSEPQKFMFSFLLRALLLVLPLLVLIWWEDSPFFDPSPHSSSLESIVLFYVIALYHQFFWQHKHKPIELCNQENSGP